jgi:hypothetical protein
MENYLYKRIEEIKKYHVFLKPEILYYLNSGSSEVHDYIDDLPYCELKFLPFYKEIIDKKLIHFFKIDKDKDFLKSTVFQVEEEYDYFLLARLQDIDIIVMTSPHEELLEIIG